MRKKGLFSATFEESRNIVKKEILTEDGAEIGVLSSMSFFQRFSGLIILLLFVIGYGVGIFLPEEFMKSTEGIYFISESSAQLTGMIGAGLKISLLVLLYFSVILVVVNILPKINYAYQLIYGVITLIFFTITSCLLMIPLSAGLTFDAFGWIGILLQFLVGIYLWKSLVISDMEQLKEQLYHSTLESNNWEDGIMAFIKKYGGILLGISIVNRWTFNFGEIARGRPTIFSFLYGWAFILVVILFFFTLGEV